MCFFDKTSFIVFYRIIVSSHHPIIISSSPFIAFHRPFIAFPHNLREIFGSTSSFQVANVPSRIFWRAVVTRSR